MTKEIPLTKGYTAIVDDADFDRLSAHKWCAIEIEGRTYAVGTIKTKFTYMHRFLMDAPKGYYVDHRNGNGLDCTRENMRIASPTQNSGNQRLSTRNTSGLKGVSFNRDRNKWEAYVSFNGKKRNLGYFTTKEAAGRAYDDAARKAFGPFACINFPNENEQAAA